MRTDVWCGLGSFKSTGVNADFSIPRTSAAHAHALSAGSKHMRMRHAHRLCAWLFEHLHNEVAPKPGAALLLKK